MVTTLARKYLRMEASLMVSLVSIKTPSFARCPEVRSLSNHKVYYVLKHCSLALVSGKFLLLLKSKNVVHIISSAHLTCKCERRMNL